MIQKYLPKRLPKNTEELITLYERYVSPITLIVGFSLDAFIIRSVELRTSVLLLLFYISLAGAAMILLNMVLAGRLRGQKWIFFVPIFPAIIQFAFGGLFSGFVILFGQSASIGISWVFVVILAGLLIGNERFRKLYTRFAFQMGIFYFGLFSFFIFALPVIMHRIGTDIFILGALLSVFALALFIRFIEYFLPELVRESRLRVIRAIATIFLLINLAYFANVIPPLPLSLKDAGAYLSVSRQGNSYVVKTIEERWFERYLPFTNVVKRNAADPIYVFSAVFAPPGLSLSVVHDWQRWDEDEGRWISESSVEFPIRGGRDEGYRGYSYRERIADGKWRVDVKTRDGRLIGRVAFKVLTTSEELPFIELKK